MLAAMYYAPMDIRLEQCPIPQVGPGEVLVQVAAATTCGTDLKAYRRGHPILYKNPPAGFGHEGAGIVAATGQQVTQFRAGDAVAIANSAPCMQCFHCRHRRFSLCENLTLLNGAYAEYLLVPQRIVATNMYLLPATTSFVAAALTEPLACALHGIKASAIEPGDTVAILGAGPLGLLLTAVAKLGGARVIQTGHGAERLALAQHFGADCIIDTEHLSPEEQCAAVRKETEKSRGADVVIEAVGSTATWLLAQKMVRYGGLVNLFGGCPTGTEVSLDTNALHYGEITLKGVFHHTPDYFRTALQLITEHKIDVEALITTSVPLAETVEVFQRLLQKQGVKYALIPPAFAQSHSLA